MERDAFTRRVTTARYGVPGPLRGSLGEVLSSSFNFDLVFYKEVSDVNGLVSTACLRLLVVIK